MQKISLKINKKQVKRCEKRKKKKRRKLSTSVHNYNKGKMK